MNLMIVDDEFYNVESLRLKIESNRPQFDEIFCAYNLKQALQFFKKHEISIIICDIEMPGGSGLELLECIRKEQRNTICIYLTAYAKFEYISQAMKLSTIDYLLKPVEDEQLFASIDKAILQFQKNQRNLANDLQIIRLKENELSIQAKYWAELLEQNKLDAFISASYAYLHQLTIYQSENQKNFQNFSKKIFELLSTKLKNNNDFTALALFQEYTENFSPEHFDTTAQDLKHWIPNVVALYQKAQKQADNTNNAVTTIKAYIHSHLNEKLDRDSLASMVYLSPDYLSHCFKNETGFSLTNYIIEVRIQEAKRLLTKKNLTICDIAITCGFQNISYFTRQFKKSTGLTPKEYRSQYLNS